MRTLLLTLVILAITARGLPAQINAPLAACADGSLEAKIAACTKAIEEKKLDPVIISIAYTNRGRWYVEKTQVDKAIADFSRAIAIDARAAPAFFHRAQLHAAAGRKEQAIADFKKVLEMSPGDAATREGLKKLGVEPPALPTPSGDGGGYGGNPLGLY